MSCGLFFSAFSNFANESKFLEIFDFTVIYLFPAIVNELCKNSLFQESNSLFFRFIRNTRVISRVLLQMWAITGLLGAGSIPQNFLYTFPIAAFIFLIPATIIEYKYNPSINKNIRLDSSKKEPSKLHDIKLNISWGNISKSRKAAIVLLIWTMFLLFMGWSANSSPDTYSPNNMYPGITFAIITFIVFISSFFSSNKFKSSASISQRIGGVVLIFFGTILCLFFIGIPMALITGTGKDDIGVFVSIGFIGVIFIAVGKDVYKGLYSRKKANKLDNYLGEFSTNETEEDCDYDDCYDYEDEIDPTDVSLIDGMDGHEFEYFCADILEKNGFTNVSVTRGSGDQGVDVLATKDGIKYAIQCKNYESALGNTPIQEVNAGKILYKCYVGVVMTNSRFTPGARELAEATGTLLWDRTDLQNMMKVLKSNQ